MKEKLQLLEDLSSYLTFSRKVSNQKGENFNLISLLKMERDEMRTHSRIIGELLDPHGTHGQGNKFLKLFLKDYNEVDFNVDDYNLYLEYHIGKIDNGTGGRIDIFLQDNVGKYIIIENKIDAGETNGQIARYRKAYDKSTIFYLTLFIEEINEELKCINITYETSIINWLEECRKESIDLPVLREALAQYSYLIKKITNQNQQSIMETEIKNRILRDDQSLIDFLELCDFWHSIVDTINQDFFNKLVKELNESFLLNLVDEVEDITDYNARNDDFYFSNTELESLGLEIGFQFDKKDKSDFSLGIYFVKGLNYNSSQYKIFRKEIEENTSYEIKSEGWLCWKYVNIIRNWKDNESLLSMRNGNALKEILKEIDYLLDIIKV